MPKEEPTSNDRKNQHENLKGGFYKKQYYKKLNRTFPTKEEAIESRGPAV